MVSMEYSENIGILNFFQECKGGLCPKATLRIRLNTQNHAREYAPDQQKNIYNIYTQYQNDYLSFGSFPFKIFAPCLLVS